MAYGVKFQFTHPGRGATSIMHVRLRGLSCFNSRTPGGVRLSGQAADIVPAQFQFTHPGRGATCGGGDEANLAIVSIHAPREGCDRTRRKSLLGSRRFQFTHPGRGATSTANIALSERVVSIHAPREGCDRVTRRGRMDECLFQFTHPGRGATGGGRSLQGRERGFNSRTPGGVRQR